MQLKQPKIRTESQGVLSEAKFGISSNDQVHILTILRDKLYSDKIMAFVREYSTNAVDAHVLNGKEKIPFRAIGPSKFDPKFSVRDYGPGLSEQDVYELYVKYGASTKRNTNDAIGQLGLGCKSAFAYTDTFTINSWHEGVHSIYTAFIDESNVGTVAKLSSVPSKEPSGVMVEIPVALKDIEEVRNKMSYCYRFFRVPPKTNVHVEKETPVVSGTGWKLMKYQATGYTRNYLGKQVWGGSKQAYAIMGDIGYPLNADLIKGGPELLQTLLKSPVQINFDIGDLSIAANREALEYTALTIGNIKKRLSEVGKELHDNLLAELDSCATVWEARKKAIDIVKLNLTGNSSLIKKLIINSVKWKHIPDLAEDRINVVTTSSSLDLCPRILGPRESRLTRVSNYAGKTAYVSTLHAVFQADTKDSYMQRALLLRKELADKAKTDINIIVLKPMPKVVTDEQVSVFVKSKGLEGISVYKLSDVAYTRSSSGSVGGGAATTKAVKTSVLTRNPNGWCSDRADRWVPAEVDLENGKGVYVIVDRFRAKDYRADDGTFTLRSYSNWQSQHEDSEREYLWRKADELREFTEFKDLKIYGFKPRVCDKIGPGWVEFREYFKEHYIKAVKSDPDLYDKLCLYRSMQHMSRYAHYAEKIVPASEFVNPDSPLLEFFKTVARVEKFKKANYYTKDNQKKWDRINKTLNSLQEGDSVKGIKVDDLMEKIYTTYPMIRHTGLSLRDNMRKDVIDYVNTVDGEIKTNDE